MNAVIAGSALFYCIAMIAMKLWDKLPLAVGIIIIGAAIVVAVALEIAALRAERLGYVYVMILAAECVIMAGVSFFAFGESFSPREIAGAGLVVAGALISTV
jgi:multidrug transporter EmrE-like cation transporter